MIRDKLEAIRSSLTIDKKIRTKINRWTPLTAFILVTTIMNIAPAVTSAYTGAQLQSRSIKMSSSAISATSVKYTVTFNIATTGTVQGVIVDFCNTDPIPGDACTKPTGFTVGTSITAGNTGLNPTASTSWTQTSANTGRTFEMTDGTGGSVTTGATISFEIIGNTNTSVLGQFWARIFTFSSTANVTTWLSTANGSDSTTPVDYGGIALSTVNQITITAKVQETLTFCVYTSAYDSGACTGTGTAVTLGSGTGVLSSANSYVDPSTKYDIQTNAASGATVRFTTSGTLGTLYSGTNQIANTPGTSGTCATNTSCVYTAGTNQFGFCSQSLVGTTITVSAPYNGANCSLATPAGANASTANFGLDIASASGTYGSTISTVTAGATAEGGLTFLGGVSVTQPAGVYTVTLTFIATGVY